MCLNYERRHYAGDLVKKSNYLKNNFLDFLKFLWYNNYRK